MARAARGAVTTASGSRDRRSPSRARRGTTLAPRIARRQDERTSAPTRSVDPVMARTPILVLAAVMVLGGCNQQRSSPSSLKEASAAVGRHPAGPQRVGTTSIACAVGARPGYFVPGASDTPPTLLGCARLGVSGKRVEFSANVARIGRRRHACVNPAYEERGRRGVYIPAICKLTPALVRFAVRDAAQPQQGVRRYAYVIWGTAGASTEVTARFAGGTAHATVIEVSPRLARRISEPPFRLFVMELPLPAACDPITIFGQGPDAIETVPPDAALCRQSSSRSIPGAPWPTPSVKTRTPT